MSWFLAALAVGMFANGAYGLRTGVIRVRFASFARATSPRLFWLWVFLSFVFAVAMGFYAYEARPRASLHANRSSGSSTSVRILRSLFSNAMNAPESTSTPSALARAPATAGDRARKQATDT